MCAWVCKSECVCCENPLALTKIVCVCVCVCEWVGGWVGVCFGGQTTEFLNLQQVTHVIP